MNKPVWWTDLHTTSWDQVKEAIRRDWDQTKHDLHAGGHELNQDADNTIKQAAGAEAMPAIDVANPPVVIGRWEDAEVAIGFGYAARTHYGDQYATWTPELAVRLSSDWKSATMPWSLAEIYVRHGYDVRR